LNISCACTSPCPTKLEKHAFEELLHAFFY
jgi:hypothetical protein